MTLDVKRYPILVVDDEQDNLDAFRFNFRKTFDIVTANSGPEALQILADKEVAVVVTDQRMPKMTGVELLREVRANHPDTVGIILTAFTDVDVLIEAINLGQVYRYITKPWDAKEVRGVLQYAIERFHLQRENKRLVAQLAEYTGYLNQQLHGEFDFGNIIGESAALREVLSKVEQVAPTASTVLLRGETGTGKELVAHAIHINSPREEKPFVRVNCAALAPGILESELFGHEKGSFTGAMARRPGRFELADGGTLFLDEVGDLPMEVQIKLLRTLQEREFERVGGAETIKVDVRLVSATNRNLEKMIEDGEFREDLYYRLNVFPINLPPLRDRLDDLPVLTGHFVAKFARQMGVQPSVASPEAIAKLREYNWPGNVRELENIIERAMILARGAPLGASHLDFGRRAHTSPAATAPVAVATTGSSPTVMPPAQGDDGKSLAERLLDSERKEIVAAVEKSRGNIASAARILGINRSTLYYRLRKHGLEHLLPTKVQVGGDEVEDALAARDHAAALGHALAFWRGCRRERVALLIDRLSAVVARTRPRPGGTSVDAKQAAWLALAANRDPGDLDGLLATLAEVRKAALLEARLAALAGRDDPRIGPAMHALLRHPPVPGATGIPVVERALELMIETGDPRSSVAFGELVRHVGTDGGGTAMWGLRQRLTSAGVRLRARLDAVATGIAAEDEARLDAIERRLDAQVRAHPQDPAALFAAVYANPDDDQARSVLADLLQEAGDPRGELIALQLARAAGGKRSKRESELLAAHAREWLGPIAPVVLKSGLVYERGFVARCRVTAEGIKHAERLVGAPEWCTVVEVDVSSWTRTPGPLLAGMPHLRVLRGLKFGSEMTSHPAIERLELAIFDRVDDFVRLELPALRALEIDSCFRTLEEMAPCWTAPVFAQLEVLAIQASPASIWLPAMARLGIPRVGYAYRSANPWRLWFEGEQVTAEYLWRSLSSDAGADLARLLELVPEPARRHLAIAQELPEGSVPASVLGRFASHRFAP